VRETAVRWRPYEIELSGPCAGNPFVDVTLRAEFRHGERTLIVSGFYAGDGVYRIRIMPDAEGRWVFRTLSDAPELDGRTGEFDCMPAGPDDHGPVRVHNSFLYNTHEPQRYPFADVGEFRRPDPAFFSHLERRIGELARLGIEADLILFHPYDRWGFADMGAEADERYVRYVVARLAAFPNAWWSMANEYDLLPGMRDVPIGGVEGAYYLAYFGFMQPRRRTFVLPPEIRFRVDVLDTWQMTVTPVPGTFAGTFSVDLPGRPFIALRLRAVD